MPKILIGSVAYIVLTFALAFVWNMILFRDTYVAMGAESLRAEPIMPLGLVAILIEAAVLGLLFSEFGDGTMRRGLALALAVGAFSIAYGALVVPAKFLIDPVAKYVALEAAFGVLHFGLAGVVLTLVFKRT